MASTPLHSTLVDLLGALRATHWHSWTTHWKCAGASFYGTHLLFQRIYSGDGGGPDIDTQTDGLAERMVALYSPSGVDEIAVQECVLKHLKSIKGQDPIQGALNLELQILKLGSKAAALTVKLPPQYSVGLDNFLRELVDARSTVVYLLQQRRGQSPDPSEFGLVESFQPSQTQISMASIAGMGAMALAAYLYYRHLNAEPAPAPKSLW